ncbi:hypothetical protein ATEIFO6365_0015017700 [Aspergillus terreus]|uniref:Uncharacterized protein n=1 Tax=Aspergillus terreus TaxID=33178 RepID=A0A5M3ZDB3_ASPTE|nr:hypothetical protein ATETN484_0016017600 [Aspergillus terreus]GFF21605.1 hypothetical protein ATEIFO6365_0015017700 [Aspergillus terreus]
MSISFGYLPSQPAPNSESGKSAKHGATIRKHITKSQCSEDITSDFYGLTVEKVKSERQHVTSRKSVM